MGPAKGNDWAVILIVFLILVDLGKNHEPSIFSWFILVYIIHVW